MSYRIEHLEKEISIELANILHLESKNPLFQFVTITKVSLTKDYSIATIWYTVMGDPSEIEATKNALEASNSFLRTMIASKVQMRKVPELRFKYDESLEYGNKIENILKNLK